MASTAAK